MKVLKLYWSNSLKDGKKNFGDWLSPTMCQLLSGCKVEYAAPNRCDLMAIGSILHKARNGWFNRKIHVWGSGFLFPQAPHKNNHYHHALRGKLSAKAILDCAETVLGDPGLLSGIFFPRKAAKKNAIGIAPHYKDQNNPLVKKFLANTKHATMIDVFAESEIFMEQIAQCEVVLSSSLHGLIIADSFRVPNAWIKPSQLVRGHDFKFHDYYSVFDVQAQPFPFTGENSVEEIFSITQNYQRSGLEKIQERLLKSFPFTNSKQNL